MIRIVQARLYSLNPAVKVRATSQSQVVNSGHGRFCASLYNLHTSSHLSSRVASMLQGHKVRLSNMNSGNGIKAFCTAQDLSMKKCVPCSSKDLRPMTEDAANHLISQVPGWNLMNEGGTWKLHRSWKVKSFTKGLEFFHLVADVAEAEGHHPDLHLVGWNNVKIDIWTHAVGGLTENDFILAAKINGLDLHHLLSKKTAK